MPEMMIVGEYLSQKDLDEGGPFRSPMNYVFRGLMKQVGINPREVIFDNVIPYPGRADSMLAYLGTKDQGPPGVKFVKRGKYLHRDHWPAVQQLWQRINSIQPNVLVAAGDLALWALTSETSMEASRGRIHRANAALPDRKVLPVYSAKHVIQNYQDRLILLSDLEKAKRESLFPEYRQPERLIYLEPNLQDMEEFLDTHLRPASYIDVDIETKQQTITCIGFAPDPSRAIVIPFYDPRKPDGNYWPTAREELFAWQWVQRVLKLPGKTYGGQNFQYDMQYLWRTMGITCPGFDNDTMLMHHALYPELRKGLGFLASLYTDQAPWKFMRQAYEKSQKKEDE